jgi:sporulation protein YlmC with PRC-barrel domain
MLSKPFTVLIPIVIVSVVIQFSPACAQGSQPQNSFPLLKANQLIGMTVENSDGRELGKVRNLALDPESGQVRYVVVATGGFLGARTRFRAVPPQRLSAATAKRDVVAMKITAERWNLAPAFKLSEITSLVHSDREQQIAGFYQSSEAPSRSSGMGQNGSRLTPTDRRAKDGSETRNPQLKLATDLIGRSIFNSDGEKLGEVSDLLVALDSERPVLVLFSAGKLFKDREHAYAVPLQDAGVGRKNKLVLDAKRVALDRAAPFNQRAWDTIAGKSEGPRIFSYAIRN